MLNSRAKASARQKPLGKVVGVPLVSSSLFNPSVQGGHICMRSESGICYDCSRIEANAHLAKKSLESSKHCMSRYGVGLQRCTGRIPFYSYVSSYCINMIFHTDALTTSRSFVWTVPVADLLTGSYILEVPQ